MKWPTQWDPDAYVSRSKQSEVHPEGESLTDQQFVAGADINEIGRRFGYDDGHIPVAIFDSNGNGVLDTADVPTLEQALALSRAGNEAWGRVPAPIRARFENDPMKLFAFVRDPANKDECIKLGIMAKPADPPAPVVVRVLKEDA